MISSNGFAQPAALEALVSTGASKTIGRDDVAGVEFINDWFSDAYPDVKPDFVSCRHVLEHIASPIAFLQGLRSHPGVEPSTVFYIEVPNALYTLRDMGIGI